jgi:hypothetical protein
MTTAIAVHFRLSWVNGWFICALARPFVSVDGVEHEARWTGDTVVDAPSGAAEVAAYFRYRGSHLNLGTGKIVLDVAEGRTVRVEARNGVMNQTPFALSR